MSSFRPRPFDFGRLGAAELDDGVAAERGDILNV
jgi:hypothetical protein